MDQIQMCPLKWLVSGLGRAGQGDHNWMLTQSLEGISQVEKRKRVLFSFWWFLLLVLVDLFLFFFFISFLILFYTRRLKSRFLCVNFPMFIMCGGASHGIDLAALRLLAQVFCSDLESSCFNELVFVEWST